MRLCEWPHLFQDFARFLSSTANRTTANKQEAPCTQLRAQECGEGVVYRPPQQHNSHIPSPPPCCVSRKIKSVCKLRKSGAVGRVPGTSPPPPAGVGATASAARASCLSCSGPAAPHPPAEPTSQRLHSRPSSGRGTGDWAPPAASCSLDLINVPRQGAARRTLPERTCWELLFKPGRLSFYLCPNLYFTTTRERERQRQSKREGEREIFPGGKEELIKKREVQDHAFTLKSLFTSKPTFLTLQPLIYICLLSNWVLPTTREQKGSFYFLPPPFKTSIKMFSVQVEWHKRWLKC